MAHWFISHSTKDGAAEAQALVQALEARGEACWVAPRDVAAGVPYPGQITRAVQAAKGLIVVVTPAANDSTDVLQEVQIANGARVKITPVIVGGAKPSDDLQYYVGVRHQVSWSNAEAVADAVAGVRRVAADPYPSSPLPGEEALSAERAPSPEKGELERARSFNAKLPRWAIPAGGAGLALLALLIWSPLDRGLPAAEPKTLEAAGSSSVVVADPIASGERPATSAPLSGRDDPAPVSSAPSPDRAVTSGPQSSPQPTPSATASPARDAGRPVSQEVPPVMAPCPTIRFTIYFHWDRTSLTPDAVAIIDAVLSQSQSCRIATVDIAGHSDTEPSAEYALALSERRAATVRETLVLRGVPLDLISTRGMGEANLAVQTPDGVIEAQNRRAVVTISFR